MIDIWLYTRTGVVCVNSITNKWFYMACEVVGDTYRSIGLFNGTNGSGLHETYFKYVY